MVGTTRFAAFPVQPRNTRARHACGPFREAQHMLLRGPRKRLSACPRAWTRGATGTPSAGGGGFDPCDIACDVSLPCRQMSLSGGFARKVEPEECPQLGVGSEEQPWNS